jgi:hypothetical protein
MMGTGMVRKQWLHYQTALRKRWLDLPSKAIQYEIGIRELCPQLNAWVFWDARKYMLRREPFKYIGTSWKALLWVTCQDAS